MSRARRILLLAAGAVAVWYVVILFTWALRPLSDAIPVGMDYTLKNPRLVSQEVDCNTLFDNRARSRDPLPELKPQPLNPLSPQIVPLQYQREACTLVQRDARIVFGLDTLGAIVVITGLVYFALRTPKEAPGTHRDPAPALNTA